MTYCPHFDAEMPDGQLWCSICRDLREGVLPHRRGPAPVDRLAAKRSTCGVCDHEIYPGDTVKVSQGRNVHHHCDRSAVG